jgi:alpha-mannosidase
MLQYGMLENLEKHSTASGAQRICAELRYLCKLSESRDGQFDGEINAAIDMLAVALEGSGAITDAAASAAEKSLLHLSPEVKKLTVIMAAHAHIDMNWMWGYDETVSITLSSFDTMLNLLDEYPDFHFSQSQASTYRIVEKHRPKMLERIKKYVREGRWEVTASEWVEPDKNMISGESQARHILHTKKYLSSLLGIDADSLNLCFLPDTFGHNANEPELLADGGIKYLYFCRGYKGQEVFRFAAPSGKSVIAYWEPLWYCGSVSEHNLLYYPDIAKRNGLDTVICVYGVGDHGGGATRKDIEKIIEFGTYPLFPTIRFGTLGEWFKTLDKKEMPTVQRELNSVFTGCYTSQSCIKAANKRGEGLLRSAEAAEAVAAAFAGYSSNPGELRLSWESILFNHFHDILPGSCVQDSRRYSMGLYQDAFARAGTVFSDALRALTDKIDYSKYIEPGSKATVSEGAGVGFAMQKGLTVNNCPARGDTRVFTVFNGTEYQRETVVDLDIWDYTHDVNRLIATDGAGNALEHVVPPQPQAYFGHDVKRISVFVSVPAFGWSTVVIAPKEGVDDFAPFPDYGRLRDIREYVLENEFIRAEFDSDSMVLVSLTDKTSGKNILGKAGAMFRFIKEDGNGLLTSWITGRILSATPLDKNIVVRWGEDRKTALTSSVSWKVAFGQRSHLKVTATLNKGSRAVEFSVSVDFREFGSTDAKDGVPGLEFCCDTEGCKEFLFDIPNGIIKRQPLNDASVGLTFAYAEGKNLQMISKDRYGYYADGDTLRLELIRGSFDPDETPEIGSHNISFALAASTGEAADLIKNSVTYLFSPVCTAVKPQKGVLPLSAGLLTVSGNVIVAALKMAESGNGTVIRLYEAAGKDGVAELSLSTPVKSAFLCDNNENQIKKLPVSNNQIRTEIKKYSTLTLLVG